jgi:hypothetical protein
MTLGQVLIQQRFCGPSTSGNGGYTCGRLADFLPGTAEVTLRSPPPIGIPMDVEAQEAGRVALMNAATVVAEARNTELSLALPEPVSWDEAVVASRAYPGFHHHQYPSCFVCGPARPLGDGLALFPGPVAGRALVAAPFTPAPDLCDADGRLLPALMWAALDCPSWYGYAAFHEPAPPILLGRLSAHIHDRPHASDRCVVLGWALGREGRKIRCASAVFEATGRALAWAEATWIVLKERAA